MIVFSLLEFLMPSSPFVLIEYFPTLTVCSDSMVPSIVLVTFEQKIVHEASHKCN